MGVKGASVEFVGVKKFVEDLGELGEELVSIIGQEASRASPVESSVVHKNVGRTGSHRNGTGHVGECNTSAQANAINEELEGTAGPHGEEPTVVANKNPPVPFGRSRGGAVQKTVCRKRFRAWYLAWNPPAGGPVHASLPVQALEEVERMSEAEVAGGIRVTSIYDPGSHEHGHIDTREGERSKGKGTRVIGDGRTDQESVVGIRIELPGLFC